MTSLLGKISTYIVHFTEAIASITGVDIEVIDAGHLRIAGTGVYAGSIGESIESVGKIYNYALTHHETIFIDNPKRHRLCLACDKKNACPEELTFCTPIIASGEVLGIIGLVCFNAADRERIIANRDVYIYFFRQIADGIARVAENERSAQKLRQSMDMLLKVTNTNDACVVVLDADSRISFINDAARAELDIHPGEHFPLAELAGAPGGNSSGDGEFELRLGGAAGKPRIVPGRLLTLSRNDPLYRRALVFDSRPRAAGFFAHSRSGAGDADALAGIVGESAAIAAVKRQILKITNTSSTVFITGESGTGKEMAARAVHAAGNRKDGPFIALNCGAIPDALLESELFGYVGGAFTGASAGGRMGKFELADQGILFLDEISSMPLYLQVKLLRVLQERSFSRLGSNKTISVDIRVIAASNEKIPDLIAQRMFREDLYYRLNVIPIDIPPLRQRLEDIPILADFFLDRYGSLFGRPKGSLSPGLLERLGGYSWPGNVREFENCIEYMVNMSESGVLDVGCLPARLRADAPPAVARAVSAVPAGGVVFSGKSVLPLAELERHAIRHALDVYGTSAESKRKAAEALGISTATLYRKLKG